MRASFAIASLAFAAACGGNDDNGGDGGTAGGTPVGSDGATVMSDDGKLTIIIPPGAVDDPIEMSITDAFEAPPAIGPAYRAFPNIDLAEMSTVIYHYDLSDIGDRDPEILGIRS